MYKYTIISLFLSLFISIYLSSDNLEKTNYLSPLFENNGRCPSKIEDANKIYCLPYKHVTFDYFFNRKYKETAISEANKWFTDNPNFKRKMEVKLKNNGRYGVFAKEKIPETEKIYHFNFYDNFGYNNVTAWDFD